MLGAGVAATLTTLTLADSVLWRSPPYPFSERLVTLYERNPELGTPQMTLSLPSLRDLEEARVFGSVAGYQPSFALTLAGRTESVRAHTNFVSREYFTLLGARAARGRLFASREHGAPMAHPVAVLSHALWTRRFGGDGSVVGSTIRLNEQPFTVIGVMSADFRDLAPAAAPTEIWLPLETYSVTGYPPALLESRMTRFLSVVARLPEDMRLEQAQAATHTLATRLAELYPAEQRGYTLAVDPLGEPELASLRPALLALVAASGFLLLVASANSANLLLVRALSRRHEIALHLALGAGSRRIFRRLSIEGLCFTLAAGLLGSLAALAALQAALVLSPISLPEYVSISPSPAVISASITLTLLVGCLLGSLPMLELRRRGLHEMLRDGGNRTTGGTHGERWRRAMVLVETASAVSLLICGLLLVQSFRRLAATDVGFDPSNILTLRTSLPATRYGDDEARALTRRLHERLLADGRVASAAVWAPDMPGNAQWFRSFVEDGRSVNSVSEAVASRYHLVSPGALEAIGLRLLRGRTISATDRADSQPVVVVSASAARALFDTEEALGRSLVRWRGRAGHEGERSYTVIGVVADASLQGRSGADVSRCDVYFPYDQLPSRELNLLVRSRGPGAASVDSVKAIVQGIDPGLPLFDVRTMRERLAVAEEGTRFSAFVSIAFAAITTLLAGVGLYSVVRQIVASRTSEVGLRLALGARPSDIVAWIGWRAISPAFAGLVLGLLAATGLGRVLAGAMPGVDPWNPRASLAVVGIMAVVTTAASTFPLLRATRTDPATTLRAE